MKKLRLFMILLIGVMFTWNSLAQKGVEDGSRYGHGEDSIRCIKNYSLYREYVKQENFKDAYPYWKIVFAECPKVSKNLYIDGAKMMKSFIANEKNAERQLVLIDSLIVVYDQRMEWYPSDEARVMSYKGIDLLRYKRNQTEVVQEAIKYLDRSIELYKTRSSAATLATFMTSTFSLFQDDLIGADEVIANYARVMDLLEKKLASNPDDESLTQVKENVESNFAASGAANCDALIELFQPQYAGNKENSEFIIKVYDLLRNTGCLESDFYRVVAESRHKMMPGAESAYEVARLFRNIKSYETAAKYYKEAIELETDGVKKGTYYVELGDITFRELGNYSLARDYARNAIQADPNSGHPYMLIGNIYVSSKDMCGSDDFEKDALYWLAVDQYAKAKSVDPELKEIADRYISQYSPHFPDVESCFFHGFKDGDEYTVECWINEKTIVRTR
jgi:tetratricopeptide (TPR) repeat protein